MTPQGTAERVNIPSGRQNQDLGRGFGVPLAQDSGLIGVMIFVCHSVVLRSTGTKHVIFSWALPFLCEGIRISFAYHV